MAHTPIPLREHPSANINAPAADTPTVGHGDAPHLPHGSWWPFWLAIGISLFGLGIILVGNSMRDPAVADAAERALQFAPSPFALAFLGFGLVFLVGSLLGWIRQDFHWWKDNVGTGTHIPKSGTLLFIGSEIFLFGALFASYFSYKAIATAEGLGWPDANEEGHVVHLPLLTTIIFTMFLFSSSWTLHKAEGQLATIVLGAIFLAGQVNEYATLISEDQTLGSSAFMTAFFMLTGTHGLHVFGGLCALIIVYVRASKGQFDERRHAMPQAVGLYWHFVDIVWVVVFTVIYLVNHDWSHGLA